MEAGGGEQPALGEVVAVMPHVDRERPGFFCPCLEVTATVAREFGKRDVDSGNDA